MILKTSNPYKKQKRLLDLSNRFFFEYYLGL